MKIFRICPAPAHTRAFRAAHHFKDKPFAEQVQIHRAENLLLPGGWAAAMEAEGFEVFETLYNDWALQGRWAFENQKDKLIFEKNWQFKILLDQVKAFQPEVIHLYAGAFFWVPRVNREQLRAVCRKPVLMTGFWGDELPAGNTYSEYFGDLDFAFCSSSIYERHFTIAGIAATTIGNPFDDTIQFSKPKEKRRDFIFCGTTGYGYPDHVGRYEKLLDLMAKTDLRIWTKEPNLKQVRWKEFLLDCLSHCPGTVLAILKALAPDPRLRRAIDISYLLREVELSAATFFRTTAHAQVNYFDNAKPLRQLHRSRVRKLLLNGSDYYTLLAGSKLTLNLHRDEDADIGNIRCFEATGLGSCLVTDRGQELREFFDVENDIVTFETVDECVEKVRYLLDHPAEMERISQNGQRATLSRHTVKHRCQAIAQTLRELLSSSRESRQVVLATYDFERHPVSYDFAFFLQAAEIYRKLSRSEGIVVSIVRPDDMQNMPGVSKEADAIVDSHARDFRVFHICTQLAELMRTSGVVSVKKRSVQTLIQENRDLKLVRFPGPEIDHHSGYYRLINDNPDLVTGLAASVEAHRFVKTWLDTFQVGRKILCITLRQYRFDPERNSNLAEWAAFLDRVDPAEFAVVVLPDTDHIVDFKTSQLGKYPCFEPACFDVDLRFALYEAAYLNMFVNNGPGAASMLDKKVRYLMFKILVPSVPHCTEEFLRWNGFEIGKTPKFATPFQKWVWADDDATALWNAFYEMKTKIDASIARVDSHRTGQLHKSIA